MRSPEVAEAIPQLVASGALPAETAAPLLREARGDLMSIRGELRAVLYAGVLAIVGGVSLLVKENLDRIGPGTIAAAIGLAAAGCLAWTLRRSPPFTWKQAIGQRGSDWALDYSLLLGILLLGADLAYIEAKFTPLGDAWTYHLLFMSLVAGALAVRCDSRTAWSLSLSTFAAWRGIAASRVLDRVDDSAVRWNLMFCGLLFLALGFWMRRFDHKRHFEPLTTFLGCLALLAAIGSFALDARGAWLPWAVLFIGAAAALAFVALRARRFGLFALGAVASYAGFTRLVFEVIDPGFGCFWFSGSSAAMLALLWIVQRRFRAELP